MKNFCVYFVLLVLLSACNLQKQIVLYCQHPQIEIYVNDEYVGNDMVYYKSSGEESIVVTAKIDGNEIYRRTIDLIGRKKNELIEIHVPEYYRYSNSRSTYKSKP
jgi:hypothetical protein